MKDRLRHGAEISWNEKGWKERHSIWLLGEMRGVETWWYGNGTRKWETMRRDLQQHGLETQWFENGTIFTKRTWKDSKYHGVTAWWGEYNKKEREIYYTRNRTHVGIEWDEEGNAIRVAEWADEGTMIKIKLPPLTPMKRIP